MGLLQEVLAWVLEGRAAEEHTKTPVPERRLDGRRPLVPLVNTAPVGPPCVRQGKQQQDEQQQESVQRRLSGP